ncbi:allantoate permease-like protein [Mrakia frigida]|uniref:allantoate permease-like protein n=1 Tax=Mrakia frigida TaxID=29902 RepID=UPI003FCBF066
MESRSQHSLDKKEDVTQEEYAARHFGEVNNAEQRVFLTDEQSRQVCRKIDKVILPLLMWVYFLQILDKSVIGYGAALGMRAQANLKGNEYSIIGSAGYWAQLGWQPVSAYLIVRIPPRILLTLIVVLWGGSMIGLAASTNYIGLLVSRFFLGLFEASCLPLFAVRVALWYGTNGVASILGSFLAFCLSYIKNPKLYTYQILFLIVGLVTVITGPLIYFRLDDNPAVARFLTEEERTWAVERLRDNNAGDGKNTGFKLKQAWEAIWSPITWLFVAMTFCINTGAAVTNVFGPLIISSFGFDVRRTLLLNIPFGVIQVSVILLSCWCATRFKGKAAILALLMIPCVAGSAILYGLGRGKSLTGPLLFGYYIIGFLFAGNPLIVSWIASNTAGQTKKSVTMAFFNAGSSVGNIVGPLLFKAKDAPAYKAGLGAVMGIFVGNVACVLLLAFVFILANKRKEVTRVKNGKPAKIHDRSMEKSYAANTAEDTSVTDQVEGADVKAPAVVLGQNGLLDLTDFENDEFVYSL